MSEKNIKPIIKRVGTVKLSDIDDKLKLRVEIYDDLKSENPKYTFADFINLSFYSLYPEGYFDDVKGENEETIDYMGKEITIKKLMKSNSFALLKQNKNIQKKLVKLNGGQKSIVDILNQGSLVEGEDEKFSFPPAWKIQVNENNGKVKLAYSLDLPFNADENMSTINNKVMSDVLNEKLTKLVNHASSMTKAETKKYQTVDDFYTDVFKEYNKRVEKSQRINLKNEDLKKAVTKHYNDQLVDGVLSLNTNLQQMDGRLDSMLDSLKKATVKKNIPGKGVEEKKVPEDDKEEDKNTPNPPKESEIIPPVEEIPNEPNTDGDIKVSLVLLRDVRYEGGRYIKEDVTHVLELTITELREKYSTELNAAEGFAVMGITDKDGNPQPLTKEIVDLCPNASTVEVDQKVKEIKKGSFSRENINDVFLLDTENYDANTGKLVWDIEQGAVENTNEDFRIHISGARRDNDSKTGWSYNYVGFTADKFNNLYYSNYNDGLKAEADGRKFTFAPSDNNKVITDIGEPVPEDKTPHYKPPVEGPKPPVQRPQRKHVYPYLLDSHRHLNFGWGSLLRWSIKHPVWSTLAITGGVLGIAGIFSGIVPAFGALFASIKTAAISVAAISVVVGGVIEIGKQILKKTNKRYKSLFLTDKANKLNRKIAEKISRVQNNMNRQQELLGNEVGLLHGNAIKKEGERNLSQNNINTIRNEHAEYLKLQKQNQKLIGSGKGITALNSKMQKLMAKVDALEVAIGGEDTVKQELRRDNVSEVKTIVEYVNRAHKQMGRVYKPNNDVENKNGESNENVYDHYRRYHMNKHSVAEVEENTSEENDQTQDNKQAPNKKKQTKIKPKKVVINTLDEDITNELQDDVQNRVDNIIEGENEYNFGVGNIAWEGKEDYDRVHNPRYNTSTHGDNDSDNSQENER